MKLKKQILASAVAAAAFSAAAQAAPLPQLSPVTVGGGTSGAVIRGGTTISSGANYLSAVPADQAFAVKTTVEVAPAHQGALGELYQVIRIRSGGVTHWYMRGPNGLQVWDQALATLKAWKTKTLAAREYLNINGVNRDLIVNAAGLGDSKILIDVFSGYKPAGGQLTYAGQSLTVSAPPNDSCPTGTERLDVQLEGKGLCMLSGEYTSDLHLTSNFAYVVSGGVFIGGDNANSAALTIDAGTTLYGESGNDFLVIRRGSRIHANGSPSDPIIMTSANDHTAGPSTRGQWGGLIINGNAPINGCSNNVFVCEAQGEGSTGTYGGNDPHDNSGNLNYLVVKYAGYEITPENELNGIAFQAVGDATNLDYIQVHNNSDDGVEFFGGTVNARHLVLTGNSDDSLDWVLGWQGKAQHVLIVQTDEGDQGFESDNLDTARDSLPRSLPTISNVTLIGNANTDLGMLLREGTGARISNAVVTGFGDACIDIDHDATFANGGSSATSLSGELILTNSIVDCAVNFDEEVGDLWSVEQWFVNQPGNIVGGADLNGYVNGPAIQGVNAASPADSFFDQTDYIGAVPANGPDWTQGWTFRDGWEQ